VIVNVAGSVTTEQDLANTIEKRLIQVWRRGGRSEILT
jgi:hypothetical protein